MKQRLHARLLADLPGAEAEADLQRRSSSTPPSASRTTGRGSPRTSTRGSRGTSTATTRRSPTSAPIPTSPRPTTTTTSSPTAATCRRSPTRGRCRTTAATSSRSRASTTRPGSSRSALSAYWRSGTPLTRYGYSDIYGRYEFFLTERGAEGRTPDNYDADLHLGYPITVGPAKLNLLLDVFNLLNTQRPVLLDQRWGFQEADNASPTPTNPDYKKPVLRTPPRSFRLGVRLSL